MCVVLSFATSGPTQISSEAVWFHFFSQYARSCFCFRALHSWDTTESINLNLSKEHFLVPEFTGWRACHCCLSSPVGIGCKSVVNGENLRCLINDWLGAKIFSDRAETSRKSNNAKTLFVHVTPTSLYTGRPSRGNKISVWVIKVWMLSHTVIGGARSSLIIVCV